tara:strand:- start:3824 stop:4786 length:963 start_codon:yes stop_codon:yes gene_type:complete
VQSLDSNVLLTDLDDDARMHVAQRAGARLADELQSPADRQAAEFLAQTLARDAIERVRAELSKAIRHASHLPRDLALMMAHDVDSVACPFLEVTEVFTDTDWQSLVLTISRSARIAVAKRVSMSERLAMSLAELGDSVVAETLAENPNAPMGGAVCDILLDRFTSEIWVIDKLADRDDLMGDIVARLTTRVSAAAREKLAATYGKDDFTAPVAADAETGAILKTMKPLSTKDLIAAAKTLHREKRLTPFLLLAALQERETAFLEIALSVVSGRSLAHVRSVFSRADETTVRGLLGKAGVPAAMQDDFWTGIEENRSTMTC